MSLSLISPELAVVVLAVLVVGLDLWLPERRKGWLPLVAVVGLAVPTALVVGLLGRRETSFYGTLVFDDGAGYFQLLFLGASALVMLSSVDYVRRRIANPGEYYAVLLMATLGAMLMAASSELLTLYIALELTSISQYVLVGFGRKDVGSSEAGLKYVVLGAISSAVLLYGIALLYGATGTTVLVEIGSRLTASPGSLVALALVVAGFGFKVAAVPFHMWVPDVYQGAPSPVAAYLSVVSKAAGFVVVLRVMGSAFTPGLGGVWPSVFGVVAAVTMTVGNVGALRQTNVKRLLGYSSIGQAGYAMMGLAALSQQTVSGLLYFLVAYAVTNLGAFAVVTNISARVGSDELGDYAGLGKRSPVLAVLMLVSLLSLVGMPPLVGFWSKVYLFWSVYSEGVVWLVVVALLNTAVAAYYYIKVVHAMYLRSAAVDKPVGTDLPLGLALGVAVAGILVFGIIPAPLAHWASLAAASFVR